MPSPRVDFEPGAADTPREFAAGGERDERVLGAVVYLDRYPEPRQPRPARVTHAGEQLQGYAALTGRILERRGHGVPDLVSWLASRGEVLRRDHAQEVAHPPIWIVARPDRARGRLQDAQQSLRGRGRQMAEAARGAYEHQ